MLAKVFDIAVVASAIAFNLLIVGILVSEKLGRHRLRKTLGIAWLALALPLGIAWLRSMLVAHDTRMSVALGVVLLYMAVEFALDYVLKIPFRDRLALHIPYILLEYAALWALIVATMRIHRAWGWVVSVCFWILMASLVYVYWDRITRRRKPKT